LTPDSTQSAPLEVAVTAAAGTEEQKATVLEDGRPLLLGAGRGDHPTREHHRGQERLRREDPADLLRHDADLDRAGAHAAVLLGEGQPEHAHLGQPRPQLLVEPGLLADGAAPGAEVGVRPAQQAADGVADRELLLVVGEVHASRLSVMWCGRCGSGLLRGPGSSSR
jgi:hypothetical protein